MGQQQADALGLLAETALQHGIDRGAPGARYRAVVGGTRVSAETSQRLACDASRVDAWLARRACRRRLGHRRVASPGHRDAALTLRATRCYNARASRPLERSGGSA